MSVQIFQWQSQLALAKNALISGDYLTAEEYLTAAMTFSHDENAPEDAVADIFYHRGICFENKDRFVDARRAFNQAQHTFSRCLGATSSQALKAGKAKCFVDIKMGRTAEAQREFAEIIELLKGDTGNFAAEISAMEAEMRDMLAHPESPDNPGTEVEIEPYAESWTPVRRPADNTHLSVPDDSHVPASFDFPSQKTSSHTPFAQESPSQPAAFGSNSGSNSDSNSNSDSSFNSSPGLQQAPSALTPGNGASNGQSSSNESDPSNNRKLSIPAEVSDAIAHLSRSGQMAAVPESYITGGVTGRLTVDPALLRPLIEPGTHTEQEQDEALKEEAARKAEEEEQLRLAEEMARQAEKEEQARIDAEEAARKVEEEEIRLAAAHVLRMAEEEEARQTAEEAARRDEEAERNRQAAEAENARIAEEEAKTRDAEEAARKAEEEDKARIVAEEAAHKAEEEEKARTAAVEAAHKAKEEEKARVAAEEAALKTEEEEKSRAAAEETARKAEEEEKSRAAAEETARKTEEEEKEKARIAAEETANKVDEEKTRTAAEQATHKTEEEEKARLAAEEANRKAEEEKARITAEESAKKAEEEKARHAAEEATRKTEEEEKEKARVASEEAARKAEEQKKLSAEAAQKAEEEARLVAEEAATKADEEARATATAARKAAQEEARLASAEAARKAREGKARVLFDAGDEDSRTSALSVDFEFDNSLALTSSTGGAAATSALKTSSEASRESWVPPPMSAAKANGAQSDAQPSATSVAQSVAPPSAQTPEMDVKVRIVRSQPEAYASKRPDGTMIDLAAFQPPAGPVVPAEPNLSIVTGQNQYPGERRKEPPVRPDGLPERRSSILAQVADEITGQIAEKIESKSSETIASNVVTSLAAQVSEAAQAAEPPSSPPDKTLDLQARAHASKLAEEASPFQRPNSYEAPAAPPAAAPAATPGKSTGAGMPAASSTAPVAPTTSSVAATAHNLPKLNSFSSTASGAFPPLATSGSHAVVSSSLSLTKPTTTSSPAAMPAPAKASTSPTPLTGLARASQTLAASAPPATPLTTLTPTTTTTPIPTSISTPLAAAAPETAPKATTSAQAPALAPIPTAAVPLTPPVPTEPISSPTQTPASIPVIPAITSPTSQESASELSSKAAARNRALSSAPLHTNTILDMPARTFNPQDSLSYVPAGNHTPDNATEKSIDVAKVSEFQRPDETANVSAAMGAAGAAPAAQSFAPTPVAEPHEGEDKFERSKVSGSRPGRVPAPVSAQKSLITPRHFIRPLNIPELTTPAERKYTQAANVAAVAIYGLSVICLVGIVLVPLIMFISHILDGIRLGRMRGNGIKVTPDQFPEVFEAVHNLAASLGMQTAPETYVMHKPGVLNASAKNYHQRDYVIIYTDVLELAYSFGESELAFVISHELAHIQCGHLKRKWLDFPAKLVPFLGQALSRARAYTCDRIAQELVPEGASVGLVALSVGTKLFRRINLKALYAQQDSVNDFWSSFSEAISNKPNLNSRIRALAPGEERNKTAKSPVAPVKKR